MAKIIRLSILVMMFIFFECNSKSEKTIYKHVLNTSENWVIPFGLKIN